MIPGIDPKIDIAFKKVFGSERSGDLTAALINAVREPPPEHRVIEVEFLNPVSFPQTCAGRKTVPAGGVARGGRFRGGELTPAGEMWSVLRTRTVANRSAACGAA